MNVSIFSQMAYENKHDWTLSENKPNSNPIKPNLKRAKMNVTLLITKDYRKNDDFSVRINKPNLVKGQKMNVNLYVIEDYENETAFRPKKTNPKQTQFKPNLRKAKMNLKSLVGKSGHTLFDVKRNFSLQLV